LNVQQIRRRCTKRLVRALILAALEEGTDEGSAVKPLVEVKANLSMIREDEFEQTQGKDQLWYYKVDFDIEMTHKSGKIAFALIYKDKRYDTVTANYVTKIV